ncbi:MAG TPA: M18 family aminopeptidase [Acidimicrobiaceae bacterium]|nr:M18 family aminopeptidase [Acidimicrobiaceae bacterium]
MSTFTIDTLRSYLDASPSPWHAAASSAALLTAAGFAEVSFADTWTDLPERGFVRRGGALIGWHRPAGLASTAPVRIVGAHTDSPCLRVKPRPDAGGFGWKQIAVEVYGGPLLNSWLDRDLGIAGVLATRDGAVLVNLHEPMARLPQLAIHLDRDVNEKGVALDKQAHLAPVWGLGTPKEGELRAVLAAAAGVAPAEIASWDLCLYDLSPAAVIGPQRDLLASGRLDNQVSCWAATVALADATPTGATSVIALFDHEEVGSDSTTGAGGPLLEHVLERLAVASGASRADFLAQLAASTCISADNAHSVHPNYPERHEPGHRPIANGGPAIKLNHNQRYATSATSAAMAQRVFEAAGVPWQVFVSRNNMPCGSTIGPITATRLGIDTVDVGVPQLSMHSARELCGTSDPVWLAEGLSTYFGGDW